MAHQASTFQGAIFDVDGVLVDSPHELAWREALQELMEGRWSDIRDRTTWSADRFTTTVYQQVMAGMPRMAGARAALEYFGVPDVDRRVPEHAAAKQEHVVELIEQAGSWPSPTRCGSSWPSKPAGPGSQRRRRRRTPGCSSSGSGSTPSAPNSGWATPSSMKA
jgi:hypothetical protein